MSTQHAVVRRGLVLAVDAGGTSTRALVLSAAGRVVGGHRAAAGNPTSAGAAEALVQVRAAVAGAVRAAGASPSDLTAAAFAMAGQRDLITPEGLASALGLGGETVVLVTSDVLAMYHSAAAEADGAVVIAGTGSIAARVRGGGLDRVVGGSGWLLGDGGSGFATGQRVARAAVADLDGSGPPTALTGVLLDACGLRRGLTVQEDGREAVLTELVSILYAQRPVTLARFAPLAFAAAADGDDVARGVVATIHDELASLVTAVHVGGSDQPLVLGGSVWKEAVLPRPGTWSPALRDALDGAGTRSARDGAVGAAVLALRAAGLGVGAHDVERIHERAEALL